jgi:two-component system, cell cycle response regulator DivK
MPNSEPGESKKRKTVLLVEDVDDIRFALKILIERYGYEVIEAADGREAVANARRHKPDLILMDLSMPTVDGFEATRKIRANPKMSQVPIVAVTAFGDRYRQEASAAGFTDFVDKMSFMQDVGGVLSRHLKDDAEAAKSCSAGTAGDSPT